MYLKDKGFGSGPLIIKGYPEDPMESLARFHLDRTKAFMQIYARIIGTDRIEALASSFPTLLKEVRAHFYNIIHSNFIDFIFFLHHRRGQTTSLD
jgi:hypothetical protein